MEIIAGVDEAGRGPLAGPVIASAVILPKDHTIEGLRDSKKLTPKKRSILYDIIQKEAISIGVGIIDCKEIDKINILQATFKAMQIALGQLSQKPTKALIDGSPLPNQVIPNEGIVGGDDLVDEIKAASIIAKVTRDNLMKEYAIIFPEYGFEKHKGYGTKQHMEALANYKSTPIHRKSFSPVKKTLPTLSWLNENKKVGWLGEKMAALYLKNKGFTILELNKNCPPHGEIDIIAQINNCIHFIEVKSGLKDSENHLLEKFTSSKLKRLYDAIHFYQKEQNTVADVQLDAMTVKFQKGGPKIKYFPAISLD